MTDLCRDCEYMRRDEAWRPRCYSPQLIKLGYAGMHTAFERDSEDEPMRSLEAGTQKCGPEALNRTAKEGV